MATTTTPATEAATTTDAVPTETPARHPRAGVSVRVRLTATVALLTLLGLALAGLCVYVIEGQRLEDQAMAGAQQELDEFARLLDPVKGDVRPTLKATLRAFLQRNVPDSDEVLVGFVGPDATVGSGEGARALSEDPAFLAAAVPLVTSGGTARAENDRGPMLLSSQPVTVAGRSGAMVVVTFTDEDRVGLDETMRTYAIVSALALLLIAGVAFTQAGRLLAPLRAVRETADEITETDLSRRLPLTGNDDVTALTRTFNGMLDRLEAAFVGQRQLLDDAGHELRTPLTILQGHLELLDADDPAEVAETRELLLDEVARMARLVDDLILLAKAERPGFLGLATVDSAELTRAVAAKAAGLGERSWSVDEVADVRVSADQQRVTQALLQLAHNAVRHTGPGDDIAFGSTFERGFVLWWVRDTGPGVAPADRERIFERFGRGSDEHADGFGLGLSIVRAIARAHGGEAWLDDDYTDGARFVVSVPAPDGPRPATPPAPVEAEVEVESTRPIPVAAR